MGCVTDIDTGGIWVDDVQAGIFDRYLPEQLFPLFLKALQRRSLTPLKRASRKGHQSANEGPSPLFEEVLMEPYARICRSILRGLHTNTNCRR